MNWWKAHHDIAIDLKYAVVQRHIRQKAVTDRNALRDGMNRDDSVPLRDGVTRAEILAVWVFLIDYSSKNSPRGSIDGLGVDEIAVSLDLSDETVNSIMDGLRWKGMITGNYLTAFEKRQPPSDRTNATRQKRLRDRRRNEPAHSNALRTVTPLRNEKSNGSNALALAREDGDGDGIEVVVKEEASSTSEEFIEPPRKETDGGVTERKKAASRLNGTSLHSVPSQSPSVSNSQSDSDPERVSTMAGYLHSYMTMSDTREFKAPDSEIVIRCLLAVNGASMQEVGQFLHDRYSNYEQSPRHAKGPKKYAWFETVLKSRFSPNGDHA